MQGGLAGTAPAMPSCDKHQQRCAAASQASEAQVLREDSEELDAEQAADERERQCTEHEPTTMRMEVRLRAYWVAQHASH